MIKKISITLLACIVIAFSFWNFFFRSEIQANFYGACSPELMAQIFNTKIESHKDLFFLEGEDKKSRGSDAYNLQPYIQSLYAQYQHSVTTDDMLANYHGKQSELFENVIKQSLQNINENSSLAEDGESTRATPVWLAALSDANSYPFIFLYKDKFQLGDPKNPKIIATVPTLIVGLESALHYAVFACNYNQKFEASWTESASIQDGFLASEESAAVIAENLLTAKRVMDYALNAYDGLAVAYPQHVAYLELIEELRTLREQFGVLEDISSSCVFPNRFNASCKK